MRKIRVLIAYAKDDGHPVRIVERLQFAHRRIQSERITSENRRSAGFILEISVLEAKSRPKAQVTRVLERNNRVEPVITSGELNHHEDFPVRVGGCFLASRNIAHPKPGHDQADAHRSRAAFDKLSSIDRHGLLLVQLKLRQA